MEIFLMDMPTPNSDTTTPVRNDTSDTMTPTNSGELTENEYEFILDSTLNPKKRNDKTILGFIESFVRCHNIRQACEENGLAYSRGYSLRNQVDVASAIQKITDKSAVKYGFDASEIMERTKELVDFDPIMLQNPDGTFKSNLHDIPPEARRALKKMKVKNLWTKEKDMNGMDQKIMVGELIEFEFYDKLKASEMVGKEKKLFKNTTVVEHDVSKNMKDILLESASRAGQRVIEVKDNGERYD